MALGIAARAYVMETGRVALSGPSAELRREPPRQGRVPRGLIGESRPGQGDPGLIRRILAARSRANRRHPAPCAPVPGRRVSSLHAQQLAGLTRRPRSPTWRPATRFTVLNPVGFARRDRARSRWPRQAGRPGRQDRLPRGLPVRPLRRLLPQMQASFPGASRASARWSSRSRVFSGSTVRARRGKRKSIAWSSLSTLMGEPLAASSTSKEHLRPLAPRSPRCHHSPSLRSSRE